MMVAMIEYTRFRVLSLEHLSASETRCKGGGGFSVIESTLTISLSPYDFSKVCSICSLIMGFLLLAICPFS